MSAEPAGTKALAFIDGLECIGPDEYGIYTRINKGSTLAECEADLRQLLALNEALRAEVEVTRRVFRIDGTGLVWFGKLDDVVVARAATDALSAPPEAQP